MHPEGAGSQRSCQSQHCQYHCVGGSGHVLLSVPCQEGQVQDQSHPVSVDKEEEGQESVDSGFGNDVGVQTVAEIDGVDVIAGAKLACAEDGSAPSSVCDDASSRCHSPFQITVHDGEEDLEEQVDGVYQHRQQVQPSFTSHCGGRLCGVTQLRCEGRRGMQGAVLAGGCVRD